MQRNCPHCGESQFVSDDLITGAWAFVKCSGCAGLAVVRSRGYPTMRAAVPKKKRIVREPVLTPEPAIAAPVSPPPLPKLPIPEPPAFLKAATPPPLPPAPEPEPQSTIAEATIELEIEPMPEKRAAVIPTPIPSFTIDEPAIVEARPQWGRMVASWGISAAVIVLAVGLLQTGWEKLREQLEHVDQARRTQAVETRHALARLPAAVAHEPPSAPLIPIVITQAAPVPAPVAPAKQDRVWVSVTAETAILRAGPGTQYKKLGLAQSELKLMVEGREGEWIAVRPPFGATPELQARERLWIRNDLVRTLARNEAPASEATQ